jgi:serine/threonine protein kinase
MESAMTTLTDFLKPASLKEALSQDQKPDDIKYQLSLDIVSGLEAMHRLRIVHGDIKPDNVLVFREKNEKTPFCAKLSDFGVCVDMENPIKELTIEDYAGTPAWLALEVRDWNGGNFQPDIMLRFDSYSLGLILTSIFTKEGAPVNLHMDGEDPADVALYYLREEESIGSEIRKALAGALRTFLATDPWKRALPTSDILKTDTAAYASW